MSKIVVLSGHTNFNTGGVGTHLRVLHNEFIRQEIDHLMILGKGKQYLLYSMIAKKILPKKAFIHFRIQVAGLKEMLIRAVKEDTKIVDCHDFPSLVAAIELKENNKTNYKYKVFYTVHAPFYEQYGLSKVKYSNKDLLELKLIELEFLKKSDGFICVDDKQKNILEKKISCNFNSLILPNAVDMDFLNKYNNLDKELCPSDYIIISRHLYKKCGVHIGIEAFSKARINRNIKLIIVGMGDEYDNLVELVRSLNLVDRVIFKGRLSYKESIKFTANALISLIPSIPLGDYVEATSLSMLESMALGIPVIASDIGGLKQVLDKTNAGILVEPNNPVLLARKIEILLENNDLRRLLSDQSRELIQNKYSSKSWVNRRLDFYDL